MHFETGRQINRRQLLAATTMLATAFVCADVLAEEVLKEISDLRPGQFTWNPDRQPTRTGRDRGVDT